MQTIDIQGIGSVIIRKSSRAKRVILKINHDNQPTVVIPKYVPYAIGTSFARKNVTWILENMKQQTAPSLLAHTKIGREHSLVFQPADTSIIKSRVANGYITITHPKILAFTETSVQKEAKKAATRALRREAEDALPTLLHTLAQRFGYSYSSVSVKNMRSRWGSCSNTGVINLNLWLMQLPDDLVEYVCCHELAHLNHPHHQKSFWNEVAEMIPDYRARRQQLKQRSPSLGL